MDQQIIKLIQQQTALPINGVKNTIKLLLEGGTIPFISRYRKEMTGSLDEVAIENIKSAYDDLQVLIKRKAAILKSIEEQKALTPALKSKIDNCWDKVTLEDIFLPFKKKVKTKATVARDNGLEPLAKIIMAQNTRALIFDAQKFISKKVLDTNAALEGARHIISEWVSEDPHARDLIRQSFKRYATIESKVVKSKKAAATKYDSYFEFSESLNKCPSHRLLAMYRGENEGLLKVKLTIDDSYAYTGITRKLIRQPNTDSADEIHLAVQDSFKRLIIPSIENETRKEAKKKADIEAIAVFAKNLKDLLLAPPLGEKTIIGLDPGFRSGCKLVVLDALGNLQHYENIFPHPPQNKKAEAEAILKKLASKYNCNTFAIGNGTAGKETYKLVQEINFEQDTECYFVNESGASIYSASKIAREEFPDHDLTVRGAVSIGRRLMDPLAELVKIDAKSIGVGQYQHDVDQKLLKVSLDNTVASCVNSVGINVNTASKELLQHVSGLGPVLAQNIVQYRMENGPFRTRKALKEVPRMGNKAFEQSAGFLRIKSSDNPLDNTAVHPEAYTLVKQMSKDLKKSIDKIVGDDTVIKNINIQNYIDDTFGIPTLTDILKELKKPGLDPRGKAKTVKFSNSINTIEDLKIGMILPGVVNNMTKFGAFVDIGVNESGLVHISQIVNRFITDPAEVLSINQEVKVKILNLDIPKKRITLSMKEVMG